jgi:outer membrane PBP1 activator LpoA protein
MQAGLTLPSVMLLCIALLSACGGNIPLLQGPPKTDDTQALEAARLEATGDARAAAQAWQVAADAASPPARQEYQLRAVAALLRAKAADQAHSVLEAIDTRRLPTALQQHKQLLEAETALATHQPDTALAVLKSIPEDTPRATQARMRAVRANAYLMNGNALECARERVNLEPLLTDHMAVRDNHRAIWSALNTMTQTALTQLRVQPPPDVLSGWMALAALGKATPPGSDGHAAALAAWQARYPKHPANGGTLNDLLRGGETPTRGAGPGQVALLLPLTGRYANEATAVRNGFFAAYYRDPTAAKATLRVYDTGEETHLPNLYRRAIADGARLVIGPLTKPAVNELAAATPHPVTVLALNHLDAGLRAPGNFFQFGLPPEDEARQIAERTALDGHLRGVAIAPAGDWGRRLLDAFTTRFRELGGTVQAVETYRSGEELATPVRRLLGYDDNAATRRQDVDFIFMVAAQRTARQLRPLFNFYQAGDLPTYTTSHAFDAGQRGIADPDMDGVTFCDMPWLLSGDPQIQALQTQIVRIWPEAQSTPSRLYALGIDAYDLSSRLDTLAQSAPEGYQGVTGRLYRDTGNRIQRQLIWAYFAGGTPRQIGAAPPGPPSIVTPPPR